MAATGSSSFSLKQAKLGGMASNSNSNSNNQTSGGGGNNSSGERGGGGSSGPPLRDMPGSMGSAMTASNRASERLLGSQGNFSSADNASVSSIINFKFITLQHNTTKEVGLKKEYYLT